MNQPDILYVVGD